MTIFGEEHFIDKKMCEITQEIDNEVLDNIHKASLKIGVRIDKDKLKHWLILCGQLENIDQSYLIDLATKRKFDEKDQQIAKLEEQLKNAFCPKYQIGERKWYVEANPYCNNDLEIFNGEIYEICINALNSDNKTRLLYKFDTSYGLFLEEEIFATEAEAQKYLEELSHDGRTN